MEGLKLQTFNVSSVDYAAYTVDVAPGSSARGVDVVFTNDAYAPARGQDRNLYVSQIMVNGRTISGSGPAAILDYGTHTAGLDWVNTTVGHLEYLTELISGEAQAREDRRVARCIQQARFPCPQDA